MYTYIKSLINIIKKTKNSFEKKQVKDTEIFLKKKKEKECQYHRDRNENLSEEEKQKKVEYMRNYYLAHKK